MILSLPVGLNSRTVGLNRQPQKKCAGSAFSNLRRNEVEVIDKSPLAIAAWLHRLGHDDLAALARQEARASVAHNGEPVSDKSLVAAFRSDLAWVTYAEMVHAFMVSADEEVLAAGDRLLRLYPEEAKQFGEAQAIVADLQRRKKAGTFGQTRLIERPPRFEGWDIAKQVAFYIDSLDQADVRQMSQPGFVVLAEDPRVQALIQIGDPAVPALIDTIDKDSRLTRS